MEDEEPEEVDVETEGPNAARGEYFGLRCTPRVSRELPSDGEVLVVVDPESAPDSSTLGDSGEGGANEEGGGTAFVGRSTVRVTFVSAIEQAGVSEAGSVKVA
ncbi:uncharacterized protein FOMMEDRAFT_170357 [Fomitiporia mediterranea MF3/22]|uniref:uncharacterized protein n=1 Tax=Fomitiporia mediterranea (strain MF3/22) TaxID=694068 RepID=UPI000440883D|nr:uncharacterized protein FOMMEDRAFT_170357 [Fomitiporia mediterranea MF3/22]EJC99797.1 hypothetical protein FOMMEDRAFT_170357 [Fomitiporia mediterranea MF3/22]